ncbi:hypothetical protein TrST_g10650 [Triparma strigata]|uniref:Uncharacterized protein n=1 Tax=Triparma strigata TaxID=1606541 RepID=A0A9W7B4B0_9STRA|nr:hypothetical protein TrST_g10650 [Triparma strigata]
MYLITSQGVIATLYPDLYTGSSDTFRSRRENLDGREKGSLSNESEVASLKAASGVPTMDLSPVPDCLALSPECAPASLLTVPLTTTCTEWKASIGCLENAGAVCTDAERDVIKSYEGALCDGDDEGPMLEESGSASAESKNSKLEVGVEDHLKGVPEESSLLRKSLIPTEDKISSYSASRRLDDAAHHFWDFRGSRTCRVYDDFATTVDLIAVPMNGATCSADGLSLDGNDDYADITDFEFGGTTSIEVYVKYDSFNNFGRVFDFSNGENSDNVYLSTWSTTSTVDWSVRRGSTQKALTTSNFDSSTWTHVVVTVSGTTMKIYKNGALAGTMTDGNEPNVLTRTQHWLGRSAWSTDGYFDGTIAYLKMWHGVELQQLDVTDLYAPHNTAHHFWDFRGCTTGGSVTDSIAGDLVATPVNGASCGADGLRLDGNNDYADIDDWEWGGTTSFEVYVKYDTWGYYTYVFDLNSGGGSGSDNVRLGNHGSSSNILWSVYQGSTQKFSDSLGHFDSATWTHVVVTVKGAAMKVYTNGVLAGTKTDGHEPNVMTRTQHWLGRSGFGGGYMDGTIAYVKIWHGVELQQSDVTSLYSPHNTAHHFWDFRGCTTGGSVTDSIAGDLVATPVNGPVCGADGLRLDGNDDYVDINDWTWGGTTSIEVYVKYDSFNSYSHVLDFGSGDSSDNVVLNNYGTTSTIGWYVYQGPTNKYLTTSNFDSSTWTHVVVTVSGTTMKIYKNGALAGTKTDGHEPNVLTRTQHWLGRSAWSHHGYFDGTIAYLKMWHGVELQQLDVTDLYAPHNTAHHFWDFRGCTTGSPVRDSTCSSSCESSSVWYFPMNQNTQYFDAESFTFSAEWTIETWVYPTDSSSKFWLNFHSEDNCMLFQTKMFPNTNQWYHMVITYTSSGMTIYRDGVVTTDGIYSSYCGSPSGSLVFGNDQDGNVVNDPSQASGHYQSTVAIYNQAKSAEEIQGTAASTEINALDPTLYALWADNTGTDLTGNGNTATLTSASVAGGPSEHSGWKQRLR